MKRTLSCLLALMAGWSAVSAAETNNWPEFRGPAGDGHSESRGLPLHWAEDKNIQWKTPIHGRGWSSPVVWGDQVWVTTATEDGRDLSVLCLNAKTGAVIHDLKLFTVETPQFAHKFNTYASPTPVIEEGRVYVTFGSPGTACLDPKTGKVLWQRTDFVCNHFRGAGSSPILYDGLLIMNFDGSDHQFVAALDKKTGETKWRTERSIDFKDLDKNGKPEADGDFRKAFATPHVAEMGGQPILVSQGAKAIYGYNPRTGQELWRVEERSSHSASTRAVAGHGLIFCPSGWSTGQLLAIVPGANGAVADANAVEPVSGGNAPVKVAWKAKRSIAKKPSLLLLGDLLFMIDDGGIATCVEAKTGTEIWRERVGGNHSSSPILADGRIYFFNEEGKSAVIEAGREFKVLAENTLSDGFMASPAVTGPALILRTKTHLYRVQNP